MECAQVLVVLTFIVSITCNAVIGSGSIDGLPSIGEISDDHPTYMTPDGITFAVWGVIYLLELLLVVAQCMPTNSAEMLLAQKCPITGLSVRWRLTLAFIMNAAWLPIYASLRFEAALVIMLVYLGALISVYSALNTATTDSFCEWLLYAAGISANLSWILVASSANVFTVAGEYGWEDQNGVAGTPEAALAVVSVVAGLAIVLAVGWWDLAWSLVAAWACAGIMRAQTTEDPESFPPQSMSPLLATGAQWSYMLILGASAVGMFIGLVNGGRQKPGQQQERLME